MRKLTGQHAEFLKLNHKNSTGDIDGNHEAKEKSRLVEISHGRRKWEKWLFGHQKKNRWKETDCCRKKETLKNKDRKKKQWKGRNSEKE